MGCDRHSEESGWSVYEVKLRQHRPDQEGLSGLLIPLSFSQGLLGTPFSSCYCLEWRVYFQVLHFASLHSKSWDQMLRGEKLQNHICCIITYVGADITFKSDFC